jgi:hypothetical protein
LSSAPWLQRRLALELLWLAHELQAEYVKDWDQRVGIYRSGFQARLPSYYLWGFRDKAGHVDEAAER